MNFLHGRCQNATYVFVMDFQMPEMDGLEFTRRQRELGNGEAILAVTAFGSKELKQSWFQAGCYEFLEKPLNKQEFISAVLRHTTAEKESVL